mmetsp:Transcript_34999/g.53729  ORF Transcript_34999/g.53729 Transcript_34999/m.53729 type:complete len:96 (+) Transcript_34999:753-1040(+)
MKFFQIDSFKVYNHITQRDLEKLSCHGVISVPMKINKCIKHYIAGIIDDREGACGCSKIGGTNHAVSLVGFGTDLAIPHSEVKAGRCNKYWLLKN